VMPYTNIPARVMARRAQLHAQRLEDEKTARNLQRVEMARLWPRASRWLSAQRDDAPPGAIPETWFPRITTPAQFVRRHPPESLPACFAQVPDPTDETCRSCAAFYPCADAIEPVSPTRETNEARAEEDTTD